jgi:hypothetical protein
MTGDNVKKEPSKTSKQPKSRRSFMKAAGGILLGMFGAVMLRNPSDERSQVSAQGTEGSLQLSTLNHANRATSVYKQASAEHDSAPTFSAIRGGSENMNVSQYDGILDGVRQQLGLGVPALSGKSFTNSPGIVGESHGSFDNALDGEHTGVVGVLGLAGEYGVIGNGRTGVQGQSDHSDGTGVVGSGAIGVSGQAPDHLAEGTGVQGTGSTGVHGIGWNEGVRGESFGTAGVSGLGWYGIWGTARDESSGDGVYGYGYNGVFGMAREFSDGDGVRGDGYTGVRGVAREDGEEGVVGEGRTGVRGVAREDDGEDGVRGEGETGVRGVARDTGEGVRGDSPQGDGMRGRGRTGVRGIARDDVDEIEGQERAGVIGEAQGEEVDGVRGENPDGDGIHGEGRTGVRGVARDNGEGVRGDSPEGDGIRGEGRTGVRGVARNDVEEHAGEERAGVIGEAQGEEADGVRGENLDGDGIHGEGRTGVRGRSGVEDGEGVRGENTRGDGVRGDGRTGVRGVARENGIGVHGRGQVGIRGVASSRTDDVLVERELPARPTAIEAIADEEDSVGIQARATSERSTALRVESTREDAVALDVRVPEGGTAIHIRGAACFDTVGAGRFSRNSRSVTVTDRRVTEGSFIYAMLTGNPSSGNSPARVGVSWIDRHPGSGFTIHLDNQVQAEVPFSYFIVEPCPDDDEGHEHHS